MPESELCRALREETQRRMECPQMIVGPLEGAFLKMMTQMVQATRCWRSVCSPAIARSVLPKRYRRMGR